MSFVTKYDIGTNKPIIPERVYRNWQEIVDSLASIAGVPSALIMHVLPDKIEVARTSSTQPDVNPYKLNDSEHLGCGLYCETVMKEKAELYVQNALKDEDWKDNPDVALNMIGYYGQPLLWSDDTVYGTICILDKKDLLPSSAVKTLLGLFRKSIENDLQLLELHHLQEQLLQSEITRQTEQINKQNTQLKELNKNLEERVKEEVEKNQYQLQKMFQHSRLAQMGEMISMIAHQWRQPISIISMGANNILVDLEFDDLDKNTLKDSVKLIVERTQELSKTIDDFRNFYKPDKESVVVKLEDVIEKSFNIIKPSLMDNNIEIIAEYNSDEEIELYDNEMMHILLNILSNAQENFQERNIKNPYIKVTTKDRTIYVCDNGGGISEDIIEKVFDPYFSTKNEKNGTGLGLYMSKVILEEHHKGKLSVKNTDNGVCFILEMGIISKQEKL